MIKPASPHCEKCESRKCNFHGQHTLAPGEGASGGEWRAEHQKCKFFRCLGGRQEALCMIRDATREDGPAWRLTEVYDPATGKAAKVPTLGVTTHYMVKGTNKLGVLKSGYVTSKGEWVIEHGGKLQKTGQMLYDEPDQMPSEHIQKGLRRSGLER